MFCFPVLSFVVSDLQDGDHIKCTQVVFVIKELWGLNSLLYSVLMTISCTDC